MISILAGQDLEAALTAPATTTQPTFVANFDRYEQSNARQNLQPATGQFDDTFTSLTGGLGNFLRYEVRTFTVHNPDTVSNTVIIRFNDQGSSRVMFRGQVPSNGTLTYQPNGDIAVFDAVGVKVSESAVSVPGASADEAITRWDGTGGNAIQSSQLSVSDLGVIRRGPDDGAGVVIGSPGAGAGTGSAPELVNMTTTERDRLVPADGMAIYNTTLGQFQLRVAGAWLSLATATTREYFFLADPSGNQGDFRIRNVGASGAHRFNFQAPLDFGSLISLQAIGIPTAGAAGPGRDIDLLSDYGALGEVMNNHDESDTAITFDLTGTSGIFTGLDISSVFSALAAGDFCGVQIDHNSIGGAIDYIGILLRYTPL